MFNKVNNKVKKAIAVSLSLVSVMSSMTALAIKPSAVWDIDNNGNRSYTDDTTGIAVVGLQDIDGVTYYFDEAGILRTGWQNINGAMYYFDPIRGMLRDQWQLDNAGNWRYLGEDGRMVRNQRVQDLNGNWVYVR